MSTKWPTVCLGDVLQHRKEFITIDDLREYTRPRVQLHAQGIVERDRVPGALIKTKEQQVCRAGEFLVAEIDAKVGGFGIVPPELDGAIVSSHYFLFVSNSEKLDRRFLGYFIKTPAFREQVEAQGSTNYAAIRPQHVLGYQLPLPPLEEQRRIVARIDALAAKIEEARGLRNAACGELETAYNGALRSTFEPFAATMSSLGIAFRVTTGGTPSRSVPAYWDGDIKWVSSGEVAFNRIKNTREKITLSGLENSNAKVCSERTILIAMIGQGKTRGQCAILECPAATNQNVAAIHVLETGHCPEYVYWWLSARYAESRMNELGTAYPALNGQRVREIPIPLPTPSEQRRIVAYLDGLQAKADRLKALQAETAAELDALLPSVLDRAFRGEL